MPPLGVRKSKVKTCPSLEKSFDVAVGASCLENNWQIPDERTPLKDDNFENKNEPHLLGVPSVHFVTLGEPKEAKVLTISAKRV